MAIISPPPLYSDVAVDGRRVNIDWLRWFNSIVQGFSLSSSLAGSVTLAAQAASVASAPVAQSLAPGVYRVSYYARVTTAATSSSSLAIDVGWTDGVIACALSVAAVTGNTTATVSAGSLIVKVDNGTDITYATTYASTGATSMQYALSLRVEALP